MKKILSTLALVVCMIAAAGCSIQVDIPEQSASSDRPAPQVTTDTALPTTSVPATSGIVTSGTVTTVPPTTEPPEESDTFPYPTVGDQAEIEYIPAEGQPQLQKITDFSADGVLSNISSWDRFMLVSFYYTNEDGYYEGDEMPEYIERTDVFAVDLLTGEVTSLQHYDCMTTVGFLENGSIYFQQYDPLVVKVYDRTGDLSFSYTSEREQVYIDTTGDGVAWISAWEGTVVERVPLDGGDVRTYTLPESDGSYIGMAINGEAYLSTFDDQGNTQLHRLTVEGNCETIAGLDGYYSVNDAFFKEVGDNLRYVDPRQSLERVCYFAMDEEDAYTLAANNGRFVLEWYNYDAEYMLEDHRLILCLPSSGRRTELSIGEDMVYGQSWSENALYLLLSDGETHGVYLWDYQAAPYDPLETGVHTLSEAELENLAYAEDLKEEWGISVYFGEEDMERTPSDYIADPLGDQQLIARKLHELSEVLSAYPEGFFYDLPYGDFDHLEIYLCEGLSPTNSYGINTAIAISNTSGSALLIVLDVTAIDDLSQTLAHELLHMMEKRIDQIDPSLLADWTTLTPGGDDAYYFSYHDENGEEMGNYSHTWQGEGDPELVYFVDAYSKSFPSEDRARVFEYLVSCAGEPAFIEAPVLRAKAERLCEIIRLTFPSVANADYVAWEVA